MQHSIDAVIVAGGSGKRLGATVPKAFVELDGKPILFYSLQVLHSHPDINRVILVVPAKWLQSAKKDFSGERTMVVAGGEQRWQSVSNGISCSKAKWVMVHDAARPFVTHTVIDNIIEKKSAFDCVITVTPEVDTIRVHEGDRAGETVDRDTLIRVGTPQLFLRDLLLRELKNASQSEKNITDEAVLMQKRGIPVGISWGDPKNFKITTPSDLEIAEAIIARDNTLLMDGNRP